MGTKGVGTIPNEIAFAPAFRIPLITALENFASTSLGSQPNTIAGLFTLGFLLKIDLTQA